MLDRERNTESKGGIEMKRTTSQRSSQALQTIMSCVMMNALVTSAYGQSNTNEEIDEIVVTGQYGYYDTEATSATRLDVPLMETPQSIYVINSELLADQQAFRMDQAVQNDSSVQKSNNFLGAYSSYAIRGFQMNNISDFLRDGRPFFHVSAPAVEIIERIEVLKGPSSVLYGRLAPGGLINMIPKRPLRERETSVKATVGQYDLYHIHVDHGGPLTASGDVRYRLNGAYEDSNSYREFADGSEFNTERKIVAAAIDWDITERTLVRASVDYTDDNRPQDIGLVNFTGDLSNYSHDLIYNQPWTKYDSDVGNLSVELTHEFTDTLTLRTAYNFHHFKRHRYDNSSFDFDDEGNASMFARRRVNRRDYSTYYADLVFKFETGLVEHQFLFGADHTNVDIDNNEAQNFSEWVTNVFTPEILPDPGLTTRTDKNIGFEHRTGVHFQDMMSMGARWRVLVGGRYDSYDQEQSCCDGLVFYEETADNFTPRVGLVFLPTEYVSLYTSYSEGFEPNAPVGQSFANAGDKLDPTLGVQYELGAKWEAFEGRLLATGAIFSVDRENAPFEDVSTNTIQSRGKQTHEGVEITVSGLVGERLSLTGSATYLDAEIVESDDADVIGNTPLGVPDLAVSLFAEYEFGGGALNGLSIQGGWFYESERPIDDANLFDLDSYNRIDAGLKYVQEADATRQYIWRLSVHNLTDERYYKGRDPWSINPERPRDLRGSLEVRF